MKRARRLIFAILACLGILVLLVTFTPLVSWWGSDLAGAWNDPRGDVLIVLGGSSSADNVIGESTYLRCQYAVIAYREGGFREIILSGGGPKPVAVDMERFLESQGIPRSVMREEVRSRSTRENALFSKALLEGVTGRKVLLTSDYHIFRARRAFQKVGLQVLPRPIPDVLKRAASWKGRWPAFLDLLMESTKIGYYYLHGWI